MEYYRFSDKKGTIFSFTVDHLAFTPNPPGIYAVIDFDGGGRFWFDMTDCDPEYNRDRYASRDVVLDEGTLMKKEVLLAYFWKVVPI